MGFFRKGLSTKKIYSWADVQRIVRAGEDKGFVFEQIEGKYFRARPEEEARRAIEETKTYSKKSKSEFFNRISENKKYKNINPIVTNNNMSNTVDYKNSYDYDEER